MSESLYKSNYDEGYADEATDQIDTPMTPREETEAYLSEYENRFVARFTEEEIITVIQGTRAEYRLLLKENKKRYTLELRKMQQDLEQVLIEENLISQGDVVNKQEMLARVRDSPETEEVENKSKLVLESKYESLHNKMSELNTTLEILRSFKDMTDEGYMEINQQLEDFDHKVARLSQKKNSMIEDFIETDIASKKNIRKCRETKEILSGAVDRVERILTQIERKERKGVDEQIKYTEYLIQVEKEMDQKNNQYEEIAKTCKQEQLVLNAQVKRKKMELQELDNKIAKAQHENNELKDISDELMAEMNTTY
ncbi:hypothetical protein LOD99_9189 [Oopsacas minuta]|uniref:Transforming acidic coiled-coil-containing protein C-terminal domain-containing protein n=1 Tax=Oopsacas minuta TaxID=111878 RepID=A0AAV7JE88_9METZ|nr:hypothetical protein LOD99_9189 [Oopsacas minuta]